MQPTTLRPLRRWRYRIFAVTWVAYAGFYLCQKNFSVLMPLLQADLGYSKIEFANVISGFSPVTTRLRELGRRLAAAALRPASLAGPRERRRG